MEIVWYGLNCFRLSQRGLASVVTDPYDASVGLELPRPRANIVTISCDSPACNATRNVRGPFRVLNTPGEYEIGGVFITGISTYADKKKGSLHGMNTIFHFDYDGLTVCHMGQVGHVPSQVQIEALGAVDVLLVPIGGDGGLTPADAAEVISLLEPAIVIPMWYKTAGVTLPLGTLNRFLKQMGIDKIDTRPDLSITRGSLPEETAVIVLQPKLEG